MSVECRHETGATPTSVLARMTSILEVFEDRVCVLRLDEVVGRTHLPRSTAHRLLESLARLGWLERRSAGYRIGPRAGRFDGYGADVAELRGVAAPHLHQVWMRTGMMVVFSMLEESDEVVLDRVGGPFTVPEASAVGYRGRLDESVSGRVMIAALPWGNRSEWIREHGPHAMPAAPAQRVWIDADRAVAVCGDRVAAAVVGRHGRLAAVRLEPEPRPGAAPVPGDAVRARPAVPGRPATWVVDEAVAAAGRISRALAL